MTGCYVAGQVRYYWGAAAAAVGAGNARLPWDGRTDDMLAHRGTSREQRCDDTESSGVGLGIPGRRDHKLWTYSCGEQEGSLKRTVSIQSGKHCLVQNKALNISPCGNSLKLFSMMDYLIRYII